MPKAVLQAFHEAASHAVSLEELQAAASRKISKLTHTEAALVTSGSAAAVTLGTAAILARLDSGRMERLPCCDGFPSEFVIAREQRSGYDHAVRAAGAKLVEVGFNEIVANAGVRRTEAWEYEAAFGPQTAGVFYVYSPDSRPRLEEVVKVAGARGLPVLVDAAGELPPRSNLTAIADKGAALVAFSGGKAIRGLQSTGILCGRKELIASAAAQMLDMDDHPELWDPPPALIDRNLLRGVPRHGIGRSMKVSKEEIIALLTALDLFVSGVYDDSVAQSQRMLEAIVEKLAETPSTCSIHKSPDGESLPILEVQIDERRLNKTAFDVCRKLRNGTPPIYVGHGKLGQAILVINPLCLDGARSEILAARLRAELAL